MSSVAPQSEPADVEVRYRVAGFSEHWVIPEVPVPEANWHHECALLLEALLKHFVARTGRDAAVFYDLAVRVREDNPRVGFDPDVCLVEPAPPGTDRLSSLRLWEAGHRPPRLVIEVVSPSHPYKDYTVIPEQCAAAGVEELVVFDPELAGPKAQGGPHLLQLWRRAEHRAFERVSAGTESVSSEVLGAFFVVSDGGTRVRISDDAQGDALWLTGEEHERALKEAALRRVKELEGG